MKKTIYLGGIAFILSLSLGAQAAYYIKYDDIEGETKIETETTRTGTVQTTTVSPTRVETSQTGTVNTSTTGGTSGGSTGSTGGVTTEPKEASADMYLEIEGVEGESSQKGNIENELEIEEEENASDIEWGWKVEKGEKLETTGVEPDEIDFDDDGEPITPDFSILLGGESDDDESADENREELAKILLEGAQEQGAPMEQISLNYEKIKTKVKQEVKLFGFIPVPARATVEIDAEENVVVKFPWWTFLASGKGDEVELGEKVLTTLSNVLKTKHDTIKNSISNVR
jgi:hypothetical protein